MNRSLALLPFVFLLTAVVAGAIWHLGDLRAQKGVQTIPTGEQVAIGGPFSLTDQDGMVRTDKDFKGKYMLVFFGYTYCPDVCPTTLAVMADGLQRIGSLADKVRPIFITVDPKRDTPEKIKAYLASFGARFIGLTGSEHAIAEVAKEYRVYYREHPPENGGEYTVDHSGVVYLMDPNGMFVTNYSLDTSPDMLADDLMKRIR